MEARDPGADDAADRLVRWVRGEAAAFGVCARGVRGEKALERGVDGGEGCGVGSMGSARLWGESQYVNRWGSACGGDRDASKAGSRTIVVVA